MFLLYTYYLCTRQKNDSLMGDTKSQLLFCEINARLRTNITTTLLLYNYNIILSCFGNINEYSDGFVRILNYFKYQEKRLTDVPRLLIFNDYMYIYMYTHFIVNTKSIQDAEGR